ncbi:hypothetical protein BLOT_006403 [Blomia tropicalis]|nr:hypothetical protein BLOT_006403 [Blomia tropicalis]
MARHCPNDVQSKQCLLSIRNVRLKITIANDIFAWHTNKRYGFTYGSFGLITMAAFLKPRFFMLTATVFIIGEVAGGGILSLPSAAAHAGWSALIMIIYCALCAGISGLCLAKSWIILEERYPKYREGLTRKPFSTIGTHAFGRSASVLVSVLMNINRIGASTVFLILTSNLIMSLTHKFISLSLCQWIPIVTAVLLIPFWLGSPVDFWPVAYMAMLSTVIGSILLIIDLILEITKNGWAKDFHIESVETVSSAFGTILFAYGGASAFPNFQNDMKQKKKFPTAVIFGFLGLISLYIPTAGLGYGAFGFDVKSSIIENLSSNGLITVIQVAFFIHCLTVIMIIINPVYLDMEELLKIPKEFNWKRCAFRTALLLLMLFIGETFPSFGQILDLIGGSAVASLAFVLPPIFYIKLCHDQEDKRKIPIYMYIIYVIIVLTGIVGGATSTYFTLKNWVPLSSACYLQHDHAASSNTTSSTSISTMFPLTTSTIKRTN